MELINQLLEYVERAHPDYTREQQFIWIAGILADTVLEKNHMDNIVLTRLNERLRHLANGR
jgi:hypothetical protein